MTDRIRISPLDMTAERDGVTVSMGRDASLVLELFVLSPGRVISPRDILIRMRGHSRRDIGQRDHPRKIIERVRKAATPLGLTIETVAGGWQMRGE